MVPITTSRSVELFHDYTKALNWQESGLPKSSCYFSGAPRKVTVSSAKDCRMPGCRKWGSQKLRVLCVDRQGKHYWVAVKELKLSHYHKET